MLNVFARVHVNRVTDPIGRGLVRRGVTPDVVTVVGTVGAVASAAWFLPRGELFAGALVITFFVMFDLVDGAMARARGHSTPFGAVLDSTCDRIVDGALFAAITWWCLGIGHARALGVAALVCLVAGQLTSYIKARAEGAGLRADGGLVERAERLIIALVGLGLMGLGVPHSLDVALWLLAAASVWTVGQRIVAVYRSANPRDVPVPDGVAEPGGEPAAGSGPGADGSNGLGAVGLAAGGAIGSAVGGASGLAAGGASGSGAGGASGLAAGGASGSGAGGASGSAVGGASGSAAGGPDVSWSNPGGPGEAGPGIGGRGAGGLGAGGVGPTDRAEADHAGGPEQARGLDEHRRDSEPGVARWAEPSLVVAPHAEPVDVPTDRGGAAP